MVCRFKDLCLLLAMMETIKLLWKNLSVLEFVKSSFKLPFFQIKTTHMIVELQMKTEYKLGNGSL